MEENKFVISERKAREERIYLEHESTMISNKWFEYALLDAWYRPISSVTVLNNEKNTVCYTTAYFDKPYDITSIKNELHTLEIDDDSMQRIIEILK